MMYNEFLELSGLQVSYEDYTDIIEPMYVAAENLSKAEFIEFIKPSAKKLSKKFAEERKAEEMANQKTVFISDGVKTPNGCWYTGKWAKLVDINMRHGKPEYKVRELTDAEAREWYTLQSTYLAYNYDIGTWETIKWVA